MRFMALICCVAFVGCGAGGDTGNEDVEDVAQEPLDVRRRDVALGRHGHKVPGRTAPGGGTGDDGARPLHGRDQSDPSTPDAYARLRSAAERALTRLRG